MAWVPVLTLLLTSHVNPGKSDTISYFKMVMRLKSGNPVKCLEWGRCVVLAQRLRYPYH